MYQMVRKDNTVPDGLYSDYSSVTQGQLIDHFEYPSYVTEFLKRKLMKENVHIIEEVYNTSCFHLLSIF